MKAVEIAGRAGGSAAKACIAEIQEYRSTGVQEYRSSGVQEFRVRNQRFRETAVSRSVHGVIHPTRISS
jgi:hypothetical protein